MDDGYSGTNYDRPGFQSMLVEIEAGRVGIVITKDLSRLGRNSALTGMYTNFTFPQYGVRYIALNDNYDTICLLYTSSEKTMLLSSFDCSEDTGIAEVKKSVSMLEYMLELPLLKFDSYLRYESLKILNILVLHHQ